MIGTFWAFMPAIVAIALALVTKQVYVSLFVGILTGAMMYAGGNPLQALGTLYGVMSEKVGENVPIIVFLVVLGIFVVLMQKSGGSRAYGEWASKNIKSRSGALAATAGLGCLIFVDDYFNCLTVGSVMRPITDKFKISHSKLAWIIDSTAAPVCIIAPISSWAAAVSGQLEGDGLVVFMQTIPFNVYALLTIGMVFLFSYKNIDFGKMKRNEEAALRGDLNAGETDLPTDEDASIVSNPRGMVRHLLVPVIILILCCVGGMIYSGFFYNWDTGTYGTEVMSSGVIEAFSNCDAGSSLAIGSTIALVLVAIYYMIEKVVSFKEITDSFTQGFKAMVPAILILTFAWSIAGIMGAKGGYLDAQAFVETNMSSIPSTVQAFFPAIFFILACVIAFSTGTSWGTFGVLVPIAVTVLGGSGTLVLITVSATLGGAVYGDHVSPISDTTILASTGGNCNHVDHVKTQFPYATVIAGIAFVSYIVAGLLSTLGSVISCLVMWAVAILLFVGVVVLISYINKKNASAISEDEKEPVTTVAE